MRWLLLALVLTGCPRRELAAPPDPVQDLLRAADIQWAQRGEVGLEAVESALHEAYRLQPRDPEVLWRLVRLTVAQGLVDPDPRASQYSFAEGRSLGMECLDLDPSFPQYRAEFSWDRAVRVLGPEQSQCLAWTALAWVRWIEAHGGAAAALDLPRVDALLNRADAVGGLDTRETVIQAHGILAAVRPSWSGQDLERADDLLGRAVTLRPDDLYRRVDQVRLALLPLAAFERAREQAEAVIAATSRTPEDARAREIAEVILEELPRRPIPEGSAP